MSVFAENQSRQLTAVAGGAAAFIIPTLFLYPQTARQLQAGTIALMLGLIAGAVIVTRFALLSRRLGMGLVINGVAMWGIGWTCMHLLSPVVGWWIYLVGWMVMTFGMLSIGTADLHKAFLRQFAPLLSIGLWPLMVELAHPAYAATLNAPTQLFIMFAVILGWILLGIGIAPVGSRPSDAPLPVQTTSTD